MNEKLLSKNPDFAEYKRRTSMFFPWLPKDWTRIKLFLLILLLYSSNLERKQSLITQYFFHRFFTWSRVTAANVWARVSK